MAETTIFDLPYPTDASPVDVAGDIQALAEAVDLVLQNTGLPFISHEVRNNSGATIPIATPVYVTGFSTKTTIAKSLGNTIATFPVIGLTTTAIANGADGVVVVAGVFNDFNTSSFTAGNILYVATAGGLTTTQPTTGSGAVGVVLKANATTGAILVLGAKGNGTWGAVKAGL